MNFETIGYLIFNVLVFCLFSFICSRILKKILIPTYFSQLIGGIIIINASVFFPDFFLKFLNFSSEKFSENFSNFFHIFYDFSLICLLFYTGLKVELKEVYNNLDISLRIGYITLMNYLIVCGSLYFIFDLDMDLMSIVCLSLAIMTTSTVFAIKYLKTHNLFDKKRGKIVMGVLLVEDIFSFTILFFSKIFLKGKYNFIIYLVSLGVVLFVCVGIEWFLHNKYVKEEPFKEKIERIGDNEEEEKNKYKIAKIIIALFIGTVSGVFFEWVGASMIIGAFFSGIIVKNIKKIEPDVEMFEKITYLVSPFFFIFSGMQLKLINVFNFEIVRYTLFFVCLSIFVKFFSIFLCSKIIKLEKKLFMEIVMDTVPRFEFSIVVGSLLFFEKGISNEIFVSILLMAMVTSLISLVYMWIDNFLNKQM